MTVRAKFGTLKFVQVPEAASLSAFSVTLGVQRQRRPEWRLHARTDHVQSVRRERAPLSYLSQYCVRVGQFVSNGVVVQSLVPLSEFLKRIGKPERQL